MGGVVDTLVAVPWKLTEKHPNVETTVNCGASGNRCVVNDVRSTRTENPSYCRRVSFPTVGVVGGGQLARMMAPVAINLGLKLHVLAEAEDVSATTAARYTVGDYTDYPTLEAFARQVDVVTFDHEHVPTEHLRRLEAAGVALAPGPDALIYAQDKLVMRRKMAELGLPQPKWAAVASVEE